MARRTHSTANDPMSKLSEYRALLQSHGLRTQAHDDHLSFVFEQGTYVLEVDDGDPDFFRLVFPNFWRLGSVDEQGRALAAAAQATSLVKVAKVFLVERRESTAGPKVGDVSAAVDLLLPEAALAAGILIRSLRTLQVACQTFALAMSSPLPIADLIEGIRRAQGRGEQPGLS